MKRHVAAMHQTGRALAYAARSTARAALWTTACAALSLTACATGRPPGFSEGTNWAIPLLGALADGTPIAPVEIDGKGPYLFAVDVDARSSLDPRLVKELGLPEPADDAATATAAPDASEASADSPAPAEAHPLAEVPRITAGTLTVSGTRFEVRPTRASYHGRPILGTLGRELFDPSLVWTIDRDQQSAYLAVPAHASTPAAAERVTARVQGDALLVTARLDDTSEVDLRVMLDQPSALRPQVAEASELRSIDDRAWVAELVAVGPHEAEEQVFVALDEGLGGGYDGVLGRAYWARFKVTVNTREQALWLTPRADDLAETTPARLARWGSLFDGCSEPACVTLAVEEALGDEAKEAMPGPAEEAATLAASAGEASSAPPVEAEADGPTLVVTREQRMQEAEYDVLLRAYDEADQPLPVPYLLVAMPKGLTTARYRLEDIAPAYLRTVSFRVIDASPFAPPCKEPSGCVWMQR
ncbi:hypothetical protein [Haliangium sp.]|uniref:hypothetical protein n=1 Tax=Haliangium sp. TaxID=2663208 RepID=UPI003D0B6A3A